MKMVLSALATMLFFTSAHAAGDKEILCWGVNPTLANSYIFDQNDGRKETDQLDDSMEITVGALKFSAQLVEGEYSGPAIDLTIEDQDNGVKVSSAYSKLSAGQIPPNSYEQLAYENKKAGTKIIFVCKKMDKNVALPGHIN